MMKMINKKSRKLFFNHVFGVFFIKRDCNKLLFKLKKIKKNFKNDCESNFCNSFDWFECRFDCNSRYVPRLVFS